MNRMVTLRFNFLPQSGCERRLPDRTSAHQQDEWAICGTDIRKRNFSGRR